MTRTPIATTSAPAAIGPYEQAVACDGWLYCSGQVALDPETGEMVGADVSSQTERVLLNLAAVLAQAGAEFEQVVKTTVYLRDMADFAEMNAVYAQHFTGSPPARATVAVVGLPKDALVEIDAVVRLP